MKTIIKRWLDLKTKDIQPTHFGSEDGYVKTQEGINDRVSDSIKDLYRNSEIGVDAHRRIDSIQSDVQLILNYLKLKKETIPATKEKKILTKIK